MAPTTILQSFDRRLPDKGEFIAEEAQKGKSSAPDAHVSGLSTEKSQAPTVGFNASYNEYWAPHAKAILDDPDVRSSLSGDHLASLDRCTVLTVEADVADASSLQLVNPVNLALSAYHEDKIAWRLRDVKDPNVHFAVVDYKRPGVIRPEEFRNGLTGIGKFGEVMSAHQEMPQFVGNSHILLKQAVNYADMYRTKYIAFFDWDILVLLYMADAAEKFGGGWCWVTVITNRSVFRRALLAFLERAYQAFKARQEGGGEGGGEAKKDGEGVKMREFPVPKLSPSGERRVMPTRATAAASSARPNVL